MAALRTPMRRRQRSVRVSVSVALLSVATATVLASLPAQSPLWLSLASVMALVLAWGALRITWTGVLRSGREQAGDRAACSRRDWSTSVHVMRKAPQARTRAI